MLDHSEKKITGPVIRLNSADNVVVARTNVSAGTSLDGYNIVSRDKAPAGYKLAICDIEEGEPILKYNTIIGFASEFVPAGAMVHNHNISFQEFDRD